VDADLAAAVAAALAMPPEELTGYREGAAAALAPYRPAAVQRLFGERVVPALGLG
jgi:hypothetical protein